MSSIMLLGGDGGLEYRVGRFGDDITKISLEETFRSDFEISQVLSVEDAPDVLLLGPELDQETLLWIAGDVDEMPVSTAVVAVAEVTPKLVLAAMRAGVRDVIDPDAPDDEFLEVLTRAREQSSNRAVVPASTSQEVLGRTVVVASPKGGVGKSTVAVNLAVDLARVAPSQVVIVDLDLRFGDVATLLDLVPDHTISDVFGSRGGLDTLALKTYLTSHASSLWVISAPESPATADAIDAEQVHQLLQMLAREFRYVVVDTGAGLDDHTLAAVEEATDAIFLTSMDVAGIRNLRKELELLGAVGILPDRRQLVLNMADNRSGMKPADVAESLGIPVDAVVPRSSDVLLASNRGVPVLSSPKASSAAAKALRSISTGMLAAVGGATPVEAKPAKSARKRHKKAEKRAAVQPAEMIGAAT